MQTVRATAVGIEELCRRKKGRETGAYMALLMVFYFFFPCPHAAARRRSACSSTAARM